MDPRTALQEVASRRLELIVLGGIPGWGSIHTELGRPLVCCRENNDRHGCVGCGSFFAITELVPVRGTVSVVACRSCAPDLSVALSRYTTMVRLVTPIDTRVGSSTA